MALLDLPEDVLLYIGAFLDIPDVVRLRRVCSRLKDLTKTRVLWARLYYTCHLLLPKVDTSKLDASRLESTIIRAAKLNKNWTSDSPKPVLSWKILESRGSSVLSLLYGGRYLVSRGQAQLIVHDLWSDWRHFTLDVIPTMSLFAEACKMRARDGILIAYNTWGDHNIVHLVFASLPRNGTDDMVFNALPLFEAPSPIASQISLSGCTVAFRCADLTTIIRNVDTGAQGTLILESKPNAVVHVKLVQDRLLVAYQSDSIDIIDVYLLTTSVHDETITGALCHSVNFRMSAPSSGRIQSISFSDVLRTKSGDTTEPQSIFLFVSAFSELQRRLIPLAPPYTDEQPLTVPYPPFEYEAETSPQSFVMDFTSGSSGTRSVALQVPSRHARFRIVSFSVDRDQLITRVLPVLVKEDDEDIVANSVAFDEVEGRLCVGTYNQGIYVFDFALPL